ncbi:hypothetical protein [Rodentibacter genomosp. 2]|uniref:Uncharacterized protein n=1 Tax=Rodentibacter genomosp. 2 TaxID=1908266 RepID=A0A1V3JBD7_9PAST|nr:hypothetical protein [Rodentibacter genomosp. 2]OOF53861.1 hypothetical protein BKK55_10705 [Rodentibacter genomosp. 2]
MLNCYFTYSYDGKEQQLAILAETVKEAKDKAKSISGNLIYLGYDEIEKDLFEGQEIAWICAKDTKELPFPFKQLKQVALFFAYGTNCQCCLGYRIMGGLVLGGLIGYLLG